MKLSGRAVAAALVIATLVAAGGVFWLLTGIWGYGGPSISVHGYIAVTIAVVGTAGLAAGLMWLAFYSSRSGWDDVDREP